MFALERVRPQESLGRGPVVTARLGVPRNDFGDHRSPKIVPISHRRLALYAQFQRDWMRLTTNDVACLMMPLHTGAARICPLLQGVSLVCLAETDIDGFFRALDEYGITWFNASAAFQRAILQRAPDYRGAAARNRLRFITVGSQRLEPEVIDRNRTDVRHRCFGSTA
jgi:acyl-CoA synthetase (AMP-forming)/AMP-acid ligase II